MTLVTLLGAWHSERIHERTDKTGNSWTVKQPPRMVLFVTAAPCVQPGYPHRPRLMPVTPRPTPTPAPLVVAASLVAVEGILLLGYAVLELASLETDRAAVALTTSAFFAVYGGFLVLAAWAVTHRRSWARSPIVLAQLIQLGVAWSFRGGETTWVAVAMAVVAVVVLVGLLSPASIEALSEADAER